MVTLFDMARDFNEVFNGYISRQIPSFMPIYIEELDETVQTYGGKFTIKDDGGVDYVFDKVQVKEEGEMPEWFENGPRQSLLEGAKNLALACIKTMMDIAYDGRTLVIRKEPQLCFNITHDLIWVSFTMRIGYAPKPENPDRKPYILSNNPIAK